MTIRRTRQRAFRGQRRGTVLLVVLIIVAVLSLGAYTFSEKMLTESQGTAMYARQVQTRLFCESALEWTATLLAEETELTEENLYHDPELFSGVLVRDSEAESGRGRFSLVAPVENDEEHRSVRFGLMDESGKLNLNTLLKYEEDAETEEMTARDRLLMLPDMTYEIADAILDWIDEDDSPREFGAEAEYYQTLQPSYAPPNGPMVSLDELLLVAGVTPELLYGEDTNRNGLLDPNENDGELSLPADNADGILQLGWSSLLTVNSRETNMRQDGTERIDVNDNLLTDLYDSLLEELGEDAARFIVAYRVSGPVAETQTSNMGSTGQTASRQDNNRNAAELAEALFGAASGENVTRGGVDLSGGGAYVIDSLYDLVDASVITKVDGVNTTLVSPWTSDPADMQSYLPTLMDVLSTTSDPYIEGRVNVNQARRDVLLTIPGITEDLATSITASSMIGTNGEPLTEVISQRSTTGWLVQNGLVDLATMRQLDRYLTSRGDVFRVQVIGYYDLGGPFARIEALIDRTETPPKVTFYRDLNELGKGYPARMLQLNY